jgi:hypothetical protein
MPKSITSRAYDTVQVPRRLQILERLRVLADAMATASGIPGARINLYQALTIAVEHAIERYTQHPTPEPKHGKRTQ